MKRANQYQGSRASYAVLPHFHLCLSVSGEMMNRTANIKRPISLISIISGDMGTGQPHPRGGIVIHGRSDATLNPGGVRIGTAEIYRIVEEFSEIAEALVIGQNYDNDTRIILFVRLSEGAVLDEELQTRIRQEIKPKASPRHMPAVIASVKDIPRTRSGKKSPNWQFAISCMGVMSKIQRRLPIQKRWRNLRTELS